MIRLLLGSFTPSKMGAPKVCQRRFNKMQRTFPVNFCMAHPKDLSRSSCVFDVKAVWGEKCGSTYSHVLGCLHHWWSSCQSDNLHSPSISPSIAIEDLGWFGSTLDYIKRTAPNWKYTVTVFLSCLTIYMVWHLLVTQHGPLCSLCGSVYHIKAWWAEVRTQIPGKTYVTGEEQHSQATAESTMFDLLDTKFKRTLPIPFAFCFVMMGLVWLVTSYQVLVHKAGKAASMVFLVAIMAKIQDTAPSNPTPSFGSVKRLATTRMNI